MKKTIILVGLVMGLASLSCKDSGVDADLASEIAGVYSMTYYETKNGGVSTGDLSGNKIKVTKSSNDEVDIIVDYIDPSIDDFNDNGVDVKQNGSGYTFSNSYADAEVTGSVQGNEITYNILYADSNFAEVKGEK